MNQDDKYFYPITPAVLHQYAESIFVPILRGECVTGIWVPMTGRRLWNKFIIENITLFKKELPDWNRYLLIYVEPLDLTEDSITGYLRLMGKSFIDVCRNNELTKKNTILTSSEIFDDMTVSYAKLLDSLRDLLLETTQSGFEVVFFLGEFDELTFASKMFHNNLKSLWSRLYPRLHYVFLMREKVIESENISMWGELNEAILQNIIYIPLGAGVETEYFIQYFAHMYKTTFTNEETSLLEKLCGAHPYMLKVACRVILQNQSRNLSTTIAELERMLLNYYELRSVSKAIYDLRKGEEKNVLKKVAGGDLNFSVEEKEVLDLLEKLKIVVREKTGELRLFGLLFREAVLYSEVDNIQTNTDGPSELEYNVQRGAILLHGKPIDEHFTHQEHQVLLEFFMKPDVIITRDELGIALWGTESYDKYSDWAIDQLMSKLRKKIKDLGATTKLLTLRGRGYKLTKQ